MDPIEPRNAEEISRAIIELLENKDLREEITKMPTSQSKIFLA